MSDPAASTGHDTPASHAAGAAVSSSKSDSNSVWVDEAEGSAAETALASPEFDEPEVKSFGNEDTHAVTVIGKMLVGFFFYSLLIMLAVAFWTRNNGGQVDPHASHAEHAEEADE